MGEQFRKAVITAMLAALLFHVIFHVSPLIGLMPRLPIALGMWLLAAFAILNALLLIGPRHTLVFFILGASIGFLAEQVGVATGWVFGVYEYTDVLGKKLGDVPWVIIFCWFMIVYLSHVVTNLIITGKPTLRSSGHHRVLLAFVTAMIATAYDVAMDPTMASNVHAWTWLHGGEYLGVPFRNFGGWMATAFAISYLYRSFEFKRPPVSDEKLEDLLPVGVVLAYGALGLFWVLMGDPADSQLVAFFVMGIPTIVAAVNLLKWEKGGSATA